MDARLVERVRRRLEAPTALDGVFSPLVRRLGVVWICVSLPVVIAVSALAHDQRSYLFVFVFFASGAFTTPALVVAWIALQRAPSTERGCHQLWFAGLVLTYATGVAMLVGLALRWRVTNVAGYLVVGVIAGLLLAGIIRMVRARSGRRALSVDMIEAAMALIVVVAPCALLWGDDVLSSDHAWFTIPAALATIGLVYGGYWAVVLFVRLGPGVRVLEACGMALVLLGAVNAALHVAQGLSGFTLPAPPLIAVHALCMSMLLLVPLHLPRRATLGLERLPPQAQVRGGGLAALLTLLGLPVLLAVTVLDRRHAWDTGYSLGVVAALLVLAAVRHLATVRETVRLYAQV
ncbi:MAG TPA: hypothetical protein VF743_03315, partial [Acidimicrobiales bacterium]